MATATTVSRTNNAEIDGLLAGTKWTGTISYSFPDSPSDYSANYYGDGEPTTSGFSMAPPAMQQAIIYAFGLIAGYTNISVQYAGNNGADIMVAQSPAANPTSYAYYPYGVPSGGDIWFGTSYPYAQAALGNYYFATALHELGHSLGLKHSQETGGVADVAVPTMHDDSEFTVMSYRSYVGAPLTGYTAESWGFSQTYMANDILALQTLYGADYSTHSENTVYSWNASTGQEYINGVAQLAPGNGTGGAANRVFETVWDGNGIDTYDLSNYTTGVTINLNPGASSITSATQLAYLGNGHYAQGNIFNAYLYNNDPRSYIDNAIGGSGNDFLIGNAIANNLTGGGGNDTFVGGGGDDVMTGGAGNDVFVGGAGNDTMAGHGGNDAYYVDDAGDIVIDATIGAGGGLDTAQSSVDYSLNYASAAGVEALVLTGSAINGTGNVSDNILVGDEQANVLWGLDGNDTFVGNGGADAMFGGTGNDTFVGGAGNDGYVGGTGNDAFYVDDAGDMVYEDVGAGNGADTVQTSVDYSLSYPQAAGVEALVLTGSAVLGVGNGSDNIIVGDAMNNTLYGMAGADNINGGTGADILIGGAGADVLTGGANNDEFLFFFPSEGGDTIKDFSHAQGDILAFDHTGFGIPFTGSIESSGAVFTAGAMVQAAPTFIYNTGTGVLSFDSNGTDPGGLTVIATLTGVPALTASDFIIT